MAQQIIGKFIEHEAVEQCVNELLKAGISKDKIGLMTHHAECNQVKPNSTGIFQKNGDITAGTGGIVVGGVLGTIIGTLAGVATFTVPGVGLLVGAGPLVVAACGGALGGMFGDGIGAFMDAPYTDANPLHPYVAALKVGEILCGVEVERESVEEVGKIVSKYAVSVIRLDQPRHTVVMDSLTV